MLLELQDLPVVDFWFGIGIQQEIMKSQKSHMFNFFVRFNLLGGFDVFWAANFLTTMTGWQYPKSDIKMTPENISDPLYPELVSENHHGSVPSCFSGV